MDQATRTTARWRSIAFGVLIVVVLLLILGLLTLIATSPLPMRGAGVFGRLANAIKGHPRATAYWVLGAGAVLWLAIAGIVMLQEWREKRRGVT